jgi:citronellol/citronellal dehydrogenase
VPPASRVFAPDLLAGQVALVTGGGTNLGLAAARELLACGAHVVVAGRREDVLQAAVETLGDGASHAVGDVRHADEAVRMVATAHERHGQLDVLVNNAGGQFFAPAEDISAKGWAAVQHLNVGGTLTMTEAAAALGFGPGGGTVIDVTVSPHQGFPGMAHSGAARAAVEALVRDQAAALAPQGVAVVALAAGRFDTESLRKYPEAVQRSAARTVPLGRLGSMEEFAWAVALLASPLGRSLSGTTFTLDGNLDNWPGAWPPPHLTEDDGTVPTETRRPTATPPRPGAVG